MAIDIGTTSTKALVVSSHGQVLMAAQQGYRTHYPQPGFAEQEPEEVWQAVATVIRQCCQAHGPAIRAASFSCAMHSLMAVDERNDPLTRFIIWADARSSAEARELKNSSEGASIYSGTGTPIHPMSPLLKLRWSQRNSPELFSKVKRFVSIKEYVLHRLCDQWVVDYSVASASGLFNIHTFHWHAAALQWAGITVHQLSRCVSPYEKLQPNQAAFELGLQPNTVLVAGANDGCLAHWGSGALEPGVVSLTIGTSGAVRMASRVVAHDTAQRLFNYRLDEQYFITGGASNNGLVLLEWMQQLVGSSTQVEEFALEAMQAPPGAGGLIFLPFVLGERAPLYNPDQRGVFLGLAQHHQRPHLMRALMEGVCFELRSILVAIEESVGSVHKVLASGGFTRSTEWLQLMANILQKEVVLNDVHDASALGAARMGFRSLRIEMTDTPDDRAQTFFPNPAVAGKYHELFRIFIESNSALLPHFSALVKLQQQG